LHSETATDLNEVIDDDSKSDPPLHAVEASIAATTQSMSPLQLADAALASGSPSLFSAEPSLFLNFLAVPAFGAPAGNRQTCSSIIWIASHTSNHRIQRPRQPIGARVPTDADAL
jgi:hypothetical protein